MLELLVVMAAAVSVLLVAALSLRPLEAPLHSGIALLEGSVERARMQAMATTSAYRLSPAGPRRIHAEFADSCAAVTWTSDPGLTVELPEPVRLADTAWALCFDSRGLPESSRILTLDHPGRGSRSLEVMLGGATRALP
jgi:hypothetical protein